MAEERIETAQKSALTLVLLALAGLFLCLSIHDAAVATSAKARGEAPVFLFLWWLPSLLVGAGRFTLLAAQMALPGLAIAVPVLALGFALFKHKKIFALLGGIICVVALGSNAALYLALGAVPTDGKEISEADARKKFKEARMIRASHTQQPEPGLLKEQENPADSQTTGTPAQTLADGQSIQATPSKTVAENNSPKNDADASASSKSPVKGSPKIAYSFKKGEDPWELWIMNPDGSGKEKLSASDIVFMQPRWAPDGTRIAFTTIKDKKPHIGIFDLKTKKETVLGEGDQTSFSASGKDLVFRKNGQVYRMNLETKKEERISPGMWTRCAYPSVSPDNLRVAVATRLLAGYNIYLLQPGQGEPKLLIGGKGTCDPRWSPTGKYLSFQTETHIHTINPDGTDALQVTFGAGVQHYATWALDESQIAYCQGPGPNGPWQIYVTSLVEDEDPVRITKEGNNIYPDWGLMAE